MTSNSIRVDETDASILEAISRAASDSGIEWFVCGASARVFVCEDVYGMRPGRATGDLDLGACVDTMVEYDNLCSLLCDKYGFEPCPEAQRLKHTSSGSIIDVLPFGAFTGQTKTYSWGDEDRFEISVLGFEEALHSSLILTINDTFDVRVASYAEQFGLKLIAWDERRHARQEYEDSRDLAYFLRHAHEWYGLEFLHDEFSSELEEFDYEIEYAAAFALGRDLERTFNEISLNRVITILTVSIEDPESPLVREVSRELPYRDPEERVFKLITIVLQGIHHDITTSRS